MRFRKTIQRVTHAIDAISVAILRLFREEVVVIGDSHAAVFREKNLRRRFVRHVFSVTAVTGATVSGLENPNSKTQAMPLFMRRIQCSRANTTIVLLGEVDTGFVIWYRAEKHQTSVEAMLEKAIANYQNLLSTVGADSRVICISAPLPTIRDGQDWGAVANARKDVKATQLERTNLTLKFNRSMEEFCSQNGFIYLSFDQESLGNNGLVSPHLLNNDAADHHYATDRYAEMIADKLSMVMH